MNNTLKVLSIISFITALLITTNNVFALCNVSTTPVTLGSYNVFSASPLDANGHIIVECDERPQARVTISIGPSQNSGGFDPRMMKLDTGNDLINYNLYTDRNRNKIYGDGTGNTHVTNKNVKAGIPWDSEVFGRIPPLQDVRAGSYSETVTVTITW
jgi:spore coat protein U-like protein